MAGWLGSGIALVALVPVLGCASAPMTLAGYKVPKRQQVAIVIDVSEQVNQADDGGAVATLAETLTNRLKENGIDSQLYTSKYDHPKPPLIDLFVSAWHGTPASAHQAQAASVIVPLAGAYAAGTLWNNMVVECKVILPGQDKPAFARHFDKTSMNMGWSATGDNAAAESAGDAIVDAILKR